MKNVELFDDATNSSVVFTIENNIIKWQTNYTKLNTVFASWGGFTIDLNDYKNRFYLKDEYGNKKHFEYVNYEDKIIQTEETTIELNIETLKFTLNYK